MLRAGLIGYGVMGKNHARILSSLDGVEFVGISDLTVNEQQNLSTSRFFSSTEKLLRESLDYVIVAVPTKHHRDVATLVAKAGVNLLIEKPVSHDLKSSLEIAKIIQNSSVFAAVGHIERFNPAVVEARKKLSQLGQIYQINTVRQGPFPGRISDVGVVKDLATHDIDLVGWITGSKYVSVSAQISKQAGRSFEDTMVATAKLENGVLVSHVVNWLNPTKTRSVLILGEKGALTIDTLVGDLTYYENGSVFSEWETVQGFRGVKEGNVTRYAIKKREPLLVEHEGFVDAMVNGGSDYVSIAEAIEVVRVAECILESAHQERVVRIWG